MKVVQKNKIPVQKCRNCCSLIELEYKDLKWENDNFKSRKNRWKCPVCKERANFIYDFAQPTSTKQEIHIVQR